MLTSSKNFKHNRKMITVILILIIIPMVIIIMIVAVTFATFAYIALKKIHTKCVQLIYILKFTY